MFHDSIKRGSIKRGSSKRGSSKRAKLKHAAGIAILAVVAIALSSCSFFRKDAAVYELSEAQRPLEVPPDLDMPNTSAAMAVPAQPHSVTRSSMATTPTPALPQDASAAASNATGFIVGSPREATFDNVGTALAAIEGVTIASRAELLGVYDISYSGSNFLVRVTEVNAGSYVSAVDPRGLPATGEASLALIAALQAALTQ